MSVSELVEKLEGSFEAFIQKQEKRQTHEVLDKIMKGNTQLPGSGAP